MEDDLRSAHFSEDGAVSGAYTSPRYASIDCHSKGGRDGERLIDVLIWLMLESIRRLKSLSSDVSINFELLALRHSSNGDPAFFRVL